MNVLLKKTLKIYLKKQMKLKVAVINTYYELIIQWYVCIKEAEENTYQKYKLNILMR